MAIKGDLDMDKNILRMGEIYWVDLGRPEFEFVQAGWHPALIIQNNKGNYFGNTIIVIPITSKRKTYLPTHVKVKAGNFGLTRDSIFQCEGQRLVSKSQVGSYIGQVDRKTMAKIANACLINTPYNEMLKYS